jgi:hypothetical protein
VRATCTYPRILQGDPLEVNLHLLSNSSGRSSRGQPAPTLEFFRAILCPRRSMYDGTRNVSASNTVLGKMYSYFQHRQSADFGYITKCLLHQVWPLHLQITSTWSRRVRLSPSSAAATPLFISYFCRPQYPFQICSALYIRAICGMQKDWYFCAPPVRREQAGILQHFYLWGGWPNMTSRGREGTLHDLPYSAVLLCGSLQTKYLYCAEG